MALEKSAALQSRWILCGSSRRPLRVGGGHFQVGSYPYRRSIYLLEAF